MQQLLEKQWHHLPLDEVTEILDSDPQRGLDLFEIGHRQKRFGPNVVTPKKGKSPIVRFLLQFNNPLIYILIIAGVVTAVLKDPVDAAIIFGVVLINGIMGYIQESKAEKSIEALAQSMTTEATVIRAGQMERIAAAQLVPGDIVVLKAGDKVPADLRLMRSRDLQVAEAALTGESQPVHKAADLALPAETILAERRNMAYASTLVTYGQATGIVTAIGDATEVGRISTLISSAAELATPLTRKIARFSKLLLYVILVIATAALVVDTIRGQALVDALMAAIALAVAMIPEGLPAALTITLAIGVARMARRRAIIRKLPAVETLGGTTVICSDKTGTLTQNQMTVQKIAVNGTYYDVTGIGYAPVGQILHGGNVVSLHAALTLREILHAGVLCNDSVLVEKNSQWQAQGDPTEVALLVVARKAGLSEAALQASRPRIDHIPFDSQHQYMATLHDKGPGQHRLVYVKGAIEAILERCSSALDTDGQTIPLNVEQIHRDVDEMARRGMRVLAFAGGEMPPTATSLHHADIASGLTFLGLQGMIDPPRPEAVRAVKVCQDAGVAVKMITGDHAVTAAAIAAQLGIDGNCLAANGLPCVLTGQEIVGLSDQELIDAVGRTAVFARVSPEQKLRLVEALQAQGNVVAMTGDGVNDGPALKQSNIGIAMGMAGTDVAKEAADMILTDDNFATIEAAVEEGRSVFDNLTKIIAWTLPTNLGEGLTIMTAVLLGIVLPILPVHILWINTATTVVLGLVLALEVKEPNLMRRPPRHPQAPILTHPLLWRILIVGAIILIGAFGLYEYALSLGADLASARTVALNTVVIIEIFYLFNCRSLTDSMFRIGVLSNRWVIVSVVVMLALQLAVTYVPLLNTVLSTAPITLADWGRILAVGFASYLIIEAEKWLRRRNNPQA